MSQQMLFAYTASGGSPPTVLGSNSGSSVGLNDRANVIYDASASAGQLLLAFITCQSSGTVAGLDPSAGYTQLYDTTVTGGNSITCAAFYKVAAGGETGADFLTDSSLNGYHSWIAYRIGNRQGNPEAATATGSDPSDSPNLTPSWGSAFNMWFTTGHLEVTSGGTPTTPTNYANAIIRDGDDGSSGIQGKVYTARRTLTAASENPGAWGTATGGVFVASTVAVRPA